MALGDLGSTDLFSLGAGFNAQSTTISNGNDVVDTLSSTGDIACQNAFNTEVTATAEYEVCGSQTLSLSLGSVVGGYMITNVEASHEAGQAPRVSVTGIANDGGEDVSGTRTYAISLNLNIAAVASVLTTPSSGIEATSVTHTWAMERTTGMGSDGQVSFAVARTPKYTYSESGQGTLASAPTITGMVLESYENSDSNQELDTYTCSFTDGLTSV